MYALDADCSGISIMVRDVNLVFNNLWEGFMSSVLKLLEPIYDIGVVGEVLRIEANNIPEFIAMAELAKKDIYEKVSTEDITEVDTAIYIVFSNCSFKFISYQKLIGNYVQRIKDRFSYISDYVDIMYCTGNMLTIDCDCIVNLFKLDIGCINIINRIYASVSIDGCEAVVGLYSPLCLLNDEYGEVLSNRSTIRVDAQKVRKIRGLVFTSYRELIIHFGNTDKTIIVYPEYDLYFRPKNGEVYLAESSIYFSKGLHYVEGVGEYINNNCEERTSVWQW